MNGESEGKLVYPGSTYRQSSTEGVVRTKGREGIFKAHRHDQKRVEIEEPVSSCRVTVDWIYYFVGHWSVFRFRWDPARALPGLSR